MGDQLLGQLVRVVCHRGGVRRGHWVSYHLVGGVWFLNDDNKRAVQVRGNPLDKLVADETVDLLAFENT